VHHNFALTFRNFTFTKSVRNDDHVALRVQVPIWRGAEQTIKENQWHQKLNALSEKLFNIDLYRVI